MQLLPWWRRWWRISKPAGKLADGFASMPKPRLRGTNSAMEKKTIIASAVFAVLLLATGLIVYFHQPAKPARVHNNLRVTEFVGVGLMLRMDNGAVVQQVVPNSPAAAAGITSGQWITKVDGVSLAGKSLAECVNLVRGPVGSTVQLELVAPDRSQTNTIKLTRQKIKVQN